MPKMGECSCPDVPAISLNNIEMGKGFVLNTRILIIDPKVKYMKALYLQKESIMTNGRTTKLGR